MTKINTSVDFAGVNFKNPIALASGTCGFGRELDEYFDIGRLGGLCSKGLTYHPHGGNDGIRVFETPSGIMNSVGLENPGIKSFIENDLDWVNSKNLVNIVNLGGHCEDDYYEGVRLLNDYKLDILELNISCPNVRSGGMNFGIKTENARLLVKKVRDICKHKLIIKLSPNAEDLTGLAQMCEDEGADGVSLTNTFLGLAIDIKNKKPIFNNVYAGLSGPAIKPLSLRMVNQVSKAINIPIVGIGGIASSEDVVEFIMAGASVVQVGTMLFNNPNIAMDIIAGLEKYMADEGISDLREIRGTI